MKEVSLNLVRNLRPGLFRSKDDFSKLADKEKLSRDDLQKIYDSIPGAPVTKRLRNRPYAIEAIWKALPEVANQPKTVKAAKPKKPPQEPVDSLAPKAPREGTTKLKVIEMLKAGTTVKAIMQMTGWLPHSVRGFISTLRAKSDIVIKTEKVDKETVYTAVA